LSFGRCSVVLCLLVASVLFYQQYSDQKTKNNNTATKRQRTTI
jgi:hypothetical protein